MRCRRIIGVSLSVLVLLTSCNAFQAARFQAARTSALFAADTCHEGFVDLVNIPCEAVKSSTRLALQLKAMGGLQHEPEKNTWSPAQLDDGLSMSYSDGSAALSVKLTEASISFSRDGSSPSMAYQLQESVVIGEYLAEISSLADGDGGEVKEGDRLVRLGAEGWEALEDAKLKFNVKRG